MTVLSLLVGVGGLIKRCLFFESVSGCVWAFVCVTVCVCFW